MKLKANGMKHIKTREVVNLKNDMLGTSREHGQDLADNEDEEANNNRKKNIKKHEMVNLKNDLLGAPREHGEDLADEEDEEANKKGSFSNLDRKYKFFIISMFQLTLQLKMWGPGV